MDANENPQPKRRSKTIAAVIYAIDRALSAVLHLHAKGESERAMRRLLKFEAILTHALALSQGVKRKLAEDLAPSNDAIIEAFAAELADLPEVAEPDHG